MNTYDIKPASISNQNIACKHSQKLCKDDNCHKCMFYMMNIEDFNYWNFKGKKAQKKT